MRKRCMMPAWLCFVAALFAGQVALAEVPGLISYQGRLLSDLGDPISGNVSFEIGLHTNLVGGAAVYAENLGSIPVQDGVYSVAFGQDKAALAAALSHAAVYLETTVNGEVMTPRERLVTVPYAMLAEEVQGRARLDHLAVTGALLLEENPGPTNRVPYVYYPQVASIALTGDTNGAIVVEAPIDRLDTVDFGIRVRGYAEERVWGVMDFVIWGRIGTDGTTNTVGNVDSLAGSVSEIRMVEKGGDHQAKHVGVVASNGRLAIIIGEHDKVRPNYRLSIDAWIAGGTNDYRSGWTVSRSMDDGFGMGDLHGPYPDNPAFGAGAFTRGSDTRADGYYSTAFGIGVEARAYASTVVGTIRCARITD